MAHDADAFAERLGLAAAARCDVLDHGATWWKVKGMVLRMQEHSSEAYAWMISVRDAIILIYPYLSFVVQFLVAPMSP